MDSREYTHPEDKAALAAMKAVPLFPACVQMFMKLVPERLLHGWNMAQKVKLGPDQLPHIYRHVQAASAALEIEEPEFFLEMNPFPNAYTYGDKKPFVTVSSGLVDSLQEHELLAVVAHECGHIACQHALYRTMVYFLYQFGARIFGTLGPLSIPVQLALFHWFRRSELSADRAAALVMRDSRPVVDVMMRMAGGPKSITDQINYDLYIQQVDEYDKLMESKWDQFLQGMISATHTHPYLAVRVREIMNWCATDHFKSLVEKDR
jgi:Zn-dependent protease with chaperone function